MCAALSRRRETRLYRLSAVTSDDHGPVGPGAALRALDRRPDKRLSQSFLREPFVARAMVQAAELQSTDTVLEIGPGLGMLTRELVRACGRVVALEVDRSLAAELSAALGNPPGLRVVEADALAADLGALVHEPFSVVASLPYHIATPLLFKLLFEAPQPRRIVAMIQLEVAQRAAAIGSEMTYLGAAFSLVADVRIVRKVSAGSFYPAPKVSSAIVRLDRLEQPRVEVDSVVDFQAFLRAGFAQPRKQLHNSLSQGLGVDVQSALAAVKEAALDARRRPGSLSLSEWAAIYRAISGT